MRFHLSFIIIILILISFSSLSADEPKDIGTGEIEQPVEVAVLHNFPPFSFMMNNQLSGFTFDYIQLIEEKTGIDFEIVSGTWKENFSAFQDGEVDMITGMSFTSERRKYTLFTDPYYLLPTVVYTRRNDFQYNRVEDLKGKTVGIESDIYYKHYLEKIPEIRLKEIEDTDELLKQLSFSEIDAVITNINIGNYIIRQFMLENIKLAGRVNLKGIEDEDLRIGVRREKPQLYALIQQGMNQITPGEYKNLQDRWVGFTPKEMQDVLSREDQKVVKEFINRYGGIRIGGYTNWYPINFTTSKGQEGISQDIFNHLSEELRIPLITEESGSIEGAIQDLLMGRIDVLPAVVPSKAYDQRIAFTKPYVRLPIVIASRSSQFFIGDLRSIEGEQIGVVGACSLDGQIQKSYPEIEFIEVASVKEGLTKVRDEKLFAFIGTVPSIAYAIKQHNFYNIKITGTLQEKLPIAAATRQQDQELNRLLNRAILSIDSDARDRIVDNWVVVQMEEKMDKTLLWQILGGATVLILIVLLWLQKVKRLNSQISEAYEMLERKNQELEHISTVNQLTGLYNRHKLDKELETELQRTNRYNRNFSLIMFDIDWFKEVNDNFGHPAGDTVLKEIASIIRRRIRATDIAGRWGGEEFLIICPETGTDGAGELAEHIRSDIEKFHFSIEKTITISAGVAEFVSGETAAQIIHRVDECLYAAKHRGKNQVVSE